MKQLSLLIILIGYYLSARAQIASIYKWANLLQGSSYKSNYPGTIKTDTKGNVFVLWGINDSLDLDPGPALHIVDTNEGRTALIKYDSSGKFIWARSIGSSASYGKLTIDKSGNILVYLTVGDDKDYDPGPGIAIIPKRSAAVMKFDNDGNFAWVKAFPITGDPTSSGVIINTVLEDEMGHLYLNGFVTGKADIDPGTGVFEISCTGPSPHGYFLCKLGEDGNFHWAKFLNCATGISYWSGFNKSTMAQDKAGNLYIAGDYSGSLDFDPGPGTFMMATATGTTESFVCKFDSSGTFIWARRMSGPNVHKPALVCDPWSGVYITGSFLYTMDPSPGWHSYILNTKGADENNFIMKLDSSGVLLWAKGISGMSMTEQFFDIDKRGHLYLGMVMLDSSFLYNRTSSEFMMYAGKEKDLSVLVKLDTAGTFSGCKILADNSSKTRLYSSYVDQQANIYIGGAFYDTTVLDPGGTAKQLISKGKSSVYIMKLGQPIPVNLDDPIKRERCSVFPNPTYGAFTLTIGGFHTSAAINILTLHGKKLFSASTTQSSIEIDLSAQAAGIYLIEICDGERKTYTKVMKQ